MRAHPLKKHECHSSRYYYATNIEGKVIRALFDGRVENAKNAKMQMRLRWLWYVGCGGTTTIATANTATAMLLRKTAEDCGHHRHCYSRGGHLLGQTHRMDRGTTDTTTMMTFSAATTLGARCRGHIDGCYRLHQSIQSSFVTQVGTTMLNRRTNSSSSKFEQDDERK